jgi:hypothetical protein
LVRPSATSRATSASRWASGPGPAGTREPSAGWTREPSAGWPSASPRAASRLSRLPAAVPRALERTGSTVTSAGLVLAGTFGVFALVEAGQPGGGVFRDILASLALGILMDAFLVRTLLVPSTVALLGRWNWWPSRHNVAAGEVSEGQQLAGTCGR